MPIASSSIQGAVLPGFSHRGIQLALVRSYEYTAPLGKLITGVAWLTASAPVFTHDVDGDL